MEEETKLETPEEKAHRKERERFMRQAITQAKKAEKLMEVPIGCVIVYEGRWLRGAITAEIRIKTRCPTRN